ncbi:prolyl oligopeptidase family serine peptidase [Saccharopolyspora sp. NPDC000995]
MFDPFVQFFTSRGVGVADIVCRGMSGFGRGYREQIYGRGGVADVEDCVVVGRELAQQHGADPAR